MKKKLPMILGALVALLVIIQFIPAGEKTNPPVIEEPKWDSPQTREFAKRACFDCHSNESVWPWYADVAPMSFLVRRDVRNGRRHLNFSEFNRKQKHAQDAAEEVEDGEMPMAIYVPLHSEAKLTDAERAQFVAGLKATFGEKKEGAAAEH